MAGVKRERAEVALALALTAWAQLEIWVPSVRTTTMTGPPLAIAAFSLAMTLPLAWRSRLPVAVALVSAGAFSLQGLLLSVPDSVPHVASLLVAVYSLGAHTGRLLAVVGLIVVLTLLLVDVEDPGDFGFIVILMLAPWIGGRVVRSRHLLVQELALKNEELEREREEKAKLAVAAERARIARELHDVLAHSVGVIVVQSETASQFLRKKPEIAETALTAIQETGRTALDEMRRMLGMLRRADRELGLEPQPALSDIDELANQMRAAGLPVQVRVVGKPRPLAPGLELAGYRIVQEALTNVTKHAGRVPTEVTIRFGNDALEIEVLDSGRGKAKANSGGHGLVGMRERVALYGGEFEASPRTGGGFGVRVRLPHEGQPR